MASSWALPDPLSFDPIEEAGRQWRKHWDGAPVSSMMAVTSVMRVQQLVLARLNDALEPFGLTFARYEALMILYYSRRGSLPLGKMGDRLQIHRTAITSIVDRLEKDGLVDRVAHASDRRTTLARVTKEGRRVAKRATAELNKAAFGTAPLEDGELTELFELLRAVRVDAGDFVA
jgi:DNA-binding MarR family transcriptional regulator